MKRLFKKFAAPVGVMALAIAGAFGTTAMKADNSLVLKDALRPTDCSLAKQCSTVGSVQCTIEENGEITILHGKFNENDTSCLQPLYEPMP